MKGLRTLQPRVQVLQTNRLNGLPVEAPDRRSSHQRGYTYRWQQERKEFLRKNPLCRECDREGILELATVVDHVKPHRGNQQLFWDQSNWQSLCKVHHDQKTGRGE